VIHDSFFNVAKNKNPLYLLTYSKKDFDFKTTFFLLQMLFDFISLL